MNNHFNNLYESGDYISCCLTSALFLAASAQWRECLLKKKLDQIYNKMGRVGLLGRRLGGAAGKPPPPYGNPRRRPRPLPPKWPKTRLRRSRFWGVGGGGDEWRCSKVASHGNGGDSVAGHAASPETEIPPGKEAGGVEGIPTENDH
jgi:hypothetical protein